MFKLVHFPKVISPSPRVGTCRTLYDFQNISMKSVMCVSLLHFEQSQLHLSSIHAAKEKASLQKVTLRWSRVETGQPKGPYLVLEGEVLELLLLLLLQKLQLAQLLLPEIMLVVEALVLLITVDHLETHN